MVELFKQLEKQEYELNFAIQQNSTALNEAINALDSRATKEDMNEDVKKLYYIIKELSNKEKLDTDDVHKLDEVENSINELYNTAIKEYQEVEENIKLMLGGGQQQ